MEKEGERGHHLIIICCCKWDSDSTTTISKGSVDAYMMSCYRKENLMGITSHPLSHHIPHLIISLISSLITSHLIAHNITSHPSSHRIDHNIISHRITSHHIASLITSYHRQLAVTDCMWTALLLSALTIDYCVKYMIACMHGCMDLIVNCNHLQHYVS